MWDALSVHAYLPLHYIALRQDLLLIVNWILLPKDFPYQACWKLFEVWEVTIGRDIKLERTGIEGNVALPSRLGSLEERRKVPQWGPGRSPGQKLIWFILSVTERVQRMHNAVIQINWDMKLIMQ